MNKNVRYPFMLLITLVGSAFVHLANASPTQLPRYNQPNIFAMTTAGSVENRTPGYRFRPVAYREAINRYRPPAGRYFGGYYPADRPVNFGYRPQFRPARFYGARFTGRNPWETAGYAYPSTRYYRAAPFQNLAGFVRGERRWAPARPMSLRYAQRGYYNQHRAPGFRPVWAGVRPGYYGRFRPLPVTRPVSPRIYANNWSRALPDHQRSFRKQFFPVSVYPSRFQQALVPAHTDSWKLANKRHNPSVQSTEYALAGNSFVMPRNTGRIRFPGGSFRQAGFFTDPRLPMARSFSTPNSGYVRSAGLRYRFRPDSRIAKRQQINREFGNGYRPSARSFDRYVPAASAKYRFRPDHRFSRIIPGEFQKSSPVTAIPSESKTMNSLPDGLGRFSAADYWIPRFKQAYPAGVANLLESNAFDSVRYMRTDKSKYIANNTIR